MMMADPTYYRPNKSPPIEVKTTSVSLKRDEEKKHRINVYSSCKSSALFLKGKGMHTVTNMPYVFVQSMHAVSFVLVLWFLLTPLVEWTSNRLIIQMQYTICNMQYVIPVDLVYERVEVGLFVVLVFVSSWILLEQVDIVK